MKILLKLTIFNETVEIILAFIVWFIFLSKCQLNKIKIVIELTIFN